MKTCSRRSLLGGVAATLSLPPLLAGCTSPLNPDGTVSAGNVSDLAVGDLFSVGHGVAIGLDDGGLYALSTVCTHAGCDMESAGTIDGSGLSCACHGSEFDPNGEVVRGPAVSPLPHYQVTVAADGSITVDPGVQVAMTDRVPVG